jgi:hypothetical protein
MTGLKIGHNRSDLHLSLSRKCTYLYLLKYFLLGTQKGTCTTYTKKTQETSNCATSFWAAYLHVDWLEYQLLVSPKRTENIATLCHTQQKTTLSLSIFRVAFAILSKLE